MLDAAKYRDLFLSEARELLTNIDDGLIKFEKAPENPDLLPEIMRFAHTLKSIAASQDLGQISNLTHSFEGMIENIKNHIGSANSSMLFGVVDEIRGLVESSTQKTQETIVNPLVDQVGELEHVDQKTEKQIIARPESYQAVNEVKVKTEKLDRLVDLAAELTVNKMRLTTSSKDLQQSLRETIEHNASLIDELQYQILQLRLLPVEYEFNRFPRMVRDLAKQQGKEIDFVIVGGELELDRSIIDSLGEPLVHLLRNAVDHGIDKKGEITLTAKRDKDHVIITVSDDGKGIDWEKVREKKAKVKTDVSDEEFLFSGISTNEHVSEVSGRGIGLSVVKEKIENLGGTITVMATEGHGTTFQLQLPISVAIIKALLIAANEHTFAVPLSSIDRLMTITGVTVQKQADMAIAVVDEEEIPLLSLSRVLGLTLPKDESASRNQIILLIRSKKKLHGFTIDTASSQQDIIVKPLSANIQNEGCFSAVTILGDGKPVPIIDVESLIRVSDMQSTYA